MTADTLPLSCLAWRKKYTRFIYRYLLICLLCLTVTGFIVVTQSCIFNPFKTKRNLLCLKTQFLPCSKHF